jgi:hypothetical protein
MPSLVNCTLSITSTKTAADCVSASRRSLQAAVMLNIRLISESSIPDSWRSASTACLSSRIPRAAPTTARSSSGAGTRHPAHPRPDYASIPAIRNIGTCGRPLLCAVNTAVRCSRRTAFLPAGSAKLWWDAHDFVPHSRADAAEPCPKPRERVSFVLAGMALLPMTDFTHATHRVVKLLNGEVHVVGGSSDPTRLHADGVPMRSGKLLVLSRSSGQIRRMA